MARISIQQNTATDILDLIFFNQILVNHFYSHEERNSLRNILEKIESKTNLESHYDQVLIKHYCLCYLEIMLSDSAYLIERKIFCADSAQSNVISPLESLCDDDLIKFGNANKIYFLGFYHALLKKMKLEGISIKALEIAECLKNDLSNYPSTIRFRLAERCYALEYPDAALDFYTWIVNLEIFKTKHKKISTTASQSCLSTMMLCDFNCLRNWFVATTHSKPDTINPCDVARITKSVGDKIHFKEEFLLRESYVDDSRKFEDLLDSPIYQVFQPDKINNNTYIVSYLRETARVFQRVRYFKNDVRAWRSIIASTKVLIKKSDIEIPKFSDSKEITLSVIGAQTLKEKGFVGSEEGRIHSRTIYNQYKALEKKLPLLSFYYDVIKSLEVVPPFEEKDIYYYSCLLAA